MDALRRLVGSFVPSSDYKQYTRHLLFPAPSSPLDVNEVLDGLVLAGLDDAAVDIVENDPLLIQLSYVLLKLARSRSEEPILSTPERRGDDSLFSIGNSSPFSPALSTPTPSSPLLTIQEGPAKPVLNDEGRDTVFGFLFRGKVRGTEGPLGTMIPHLKPLEPSSTRSPPQPALPPHPPFPPSPSPHTLKFDIILPSHPPPLPLSSHPTILAMETECKILSLTSPNSPRHIHLSNQLKSIVLLSFRRMLKSKLYQSSPESLTSLKSVDELLVRAADGDVVGKGYRRTVRDEVEGRIDRMEREKAVKEETKRLEILRKEGELKRAELSRWKKTQSSVVEARARIVKKYEALMKESEEKLERAKTEIAEKIALTPSPLRRRPPHTTPKAAEGGGSDLFSTMSQPPSFRPSTSVLQPPGGASPTPQTPTTTTTRVLKEPGGGTTVELSPANTNIRIFEERRGTEDVPTSTIRITNAISATSSQIDLRDNAVYEPDKRTSVRIVPQAQNSKQTVTRSAVRVSQLPGGDETQQAEFKSNIKVLRVPGGPRTSDEIVDRGVKVLQSPGGEESSTISSPPLSSVRVLQSPGGETTSSTATIASVRVTQAPGGEVSKTDELEKSRGVRTGYGSISEGGGVKKSLAWGEQTAAKDARGSGFVDNDKQNIPNSEEFDSSPAPHETPTLDLFDIPDVDLFNSTLHDQTTLVAPSLDYKEYSLMLHSIIKFLRKQSAKVEFVDLWFSTDLPKIINAVNVHYLQNSFSDSSGPPTLPPSMTSFLSPLKEIRLVMKEIKKATSKLRVLQSSLSTMKGSAKRLRLLSIFKYNAMRFVNGWSTYVGLTVEIHRRHFEREFDVRKIDSIDGFNELYDGFLENVKSGLLIKTETLSQGKLALILSQVLTLASSTSSFIASNISSNENIDDMKVGAWDYVCDKIKRFNRARERCCAEANECLVREEIGGGVCTYW